MKKFFENFKEWLGQSNRMTHLGMGFFIFILTLLFSLSLMSLAEGDLNITQKLADRLMIASIVDADWCVFGCMCAVEFDQKLHGENFDWSDVLAGCIVPFALTTILSLLIFIV